MNLNIIFCGSPEFSCESLAILAKLNINKTITVITQPDKIRKRGNKIQPTPVKALALQHNLTVHTPKSKNEFEKLITNIKPDLIIVIAYAMIIPKDITDTYLCINAHTSLLPKYRGASPIQTALLNQDNETGISLIQMNSKLDEGNIITQTTIPIEKTDTYGLLHDKLATLTANMILELVQSYLKNPNVGSTPQNHKLASYCSKITTSDCQLNINDPIKTNLAKIKAYSPKPGAYLTIQQQKIKILDAKIESNTLIPLQVQPEGKKAMSYTDYLLGNKKEISLC
ncbi:MAG: methionyl-tRNA formyltransferase [Rickettsiales bacterium]|nr:methionyl-tRNA formyltransferase [Rickettsiales bacterium]|tara:strand:- start:17824 stop:18675 length:852 start_codon:yes stop_codon:yes gene_type:complete